MNNQTNIAVKHEQSSAEAPANKGGAHPRATGMRISTDSARSNKPGHNSVEKRLDEIGERIKALGQEADDFLTQYFDTFNEQIATRQTAFFPLGVAAATHLLGTPPPIEIINGGNRTPKLKGAASL